jgi:cell division protein FtsB
MENARTGKPLLSRGVVLLLMLLALSAYSGGGVAQAIDAALEQELTDAKVALDAALKAQAEALAPAQLQQSRDYLEAADQAREGSDPTRFSRVARMARAYADYAKAVAELGQEAQKLAATQEDLATAKAEIERLRRQ